MSGADQFTCKECGTVGDYYATRKARDPRPGLRRVICADCADRIKKNTSQLHLVDKAARSYRKAGPSSEAAKGASLASAETCATILRQLMIEPLTPDEIARTTDLVLNTVRARITNMKDFGYVRDTGKARIATDAGKQATVWDITAAGREWLAGRRAAA